jgi:hypothetical protein
VYRTRGRRFSESLRKGTGHADQSGGTGTQVARRKEEESLGPPLGHPVEGPSVDRHRRDPADFVVHVAGGSNRRRGQFSQGELSRFRNRHQRVERPAHSPSSQKSNFDKFSASGFVFNDVLPIAVQRRRHSTFERLGASHHHRPNKRFRYQRDRESRQEKDQFSFVQSGFQF